MENLITQHNQFACHVSLYEQYLIQNYNVYSMTAACELPTPSAESGLTPSMPTTVPKVDNRIPVGENVSVYCQANHSFTDNKHKTLEQPLTCDALNTWSDGPPQCSKSMIH